MILGGPEETELWSLSQDLYLDLASGMSSANIREIKMSCEGHTIKLLRRKVGFHEIVASGRRARAA